MGIRDFTLTDVDSKDALDAAGCLTSAALASPQLNFQFRDGDSHDIKLEPSPSIFAAGVIEALGASAPVAFSATSGDIQAALTFNCHDAGTSGSIKGLVTKDDDVLELSTSRDEPSIQQHINDNGAIKSDGVHIAAVFSMGDIFAEDAKALSTADFLEPDDDGSESLGMKVDGPRRKLAVPRWTSCFTDDSVRRELNLGIAIGSTLYKNKYGSSKQKTIDEVGEMITKTNLVYGGQINVVFKVGKIFIAGQDGSPSWDNYAQCNPHRQSINSQLSQFKSWAPKSPGEGGLWHLLDDCFAGSGVVGLAWVGTLCNTRRGSHTGISWWSRRHWLTFAHELGHNFGASHSFEEGQGRTGGIMDYGSGLLNGEYQFNTKYRKKQMCRTINNVVSSCSAFSKLDGSPTPPPAPGPNPTPSPPRPAPAPGCSTTGGGSGAGSTCVFPFTFKDVTYTQCTTVDDPEDIKWCSTRTNSNGKHIKGTWAHCNPGCPGMPNAPQPTPSPPAPTKRPTNQPTERPTQRPADPTSRPTDRPTERPNNPTPNPQPTPNPFGPGCDDLIPMAVQTQMNGYKEQVAAAQAEVAALKKQLAEMTGKTINEVQAESVNNRKLRAGSKWVPM